jgi:hypothetical protein
MYEDALFHAFIASRTNNVHAPARKLRYLFNMANKHRLRAAGQPFPKPGPYLLYRGVAGHGNARRVRGYSWTSSLERARWFATRYESQLMHPAVFRVMVRKNHVLAYSNERGEEEYIVRLPPKAKPERIALS